MTRTLPSDLAGHNKVPAVTLTFWLIKMMSTTVGETAADYLNFNLHFGLTMTSLLMGVLLLAALLLQMSHHSYVPWRYWLTVVLVSIFGTLVTDNLTDQLDVPLMLSTASFSVLLILVFGIWFLQERTLAISAINTPKREAFYWLAILVTFALGTGAGDWVSEGMDLGYAHSALLFGGLIAIIALAYYLKKLDQVTAFWLVYILTRPLGASIGDLLSQSSGSGGLDLGVTHTSLAFLLLIALLVIQESRQYRKQPC